MISVSQNTLYLLGLLTGIITGLTTGAAALVDLLPGMKGSAAAPWIVRAINGCLNLLAVFGVEAAQHTFTLDHWVAYLLAAATMSTLGTGLYHATTARTRADRDTARAQVLLLHSMVQRAAQDERGQATFVA